MRSHRLVHTGKGRFWEVHWEGGEVETTSGALGTNGRSSAKSMGVREAEAWVAEQLAKRRKEGFVELTEVGTRSAPLVVDSLLEQIRATPEDDAPRLVYADQLTSAGDPLGEFIAVQVSLARAPNGPDAAVHRHRERELLERFRGQWSGKLRGVDFRFERGFAVEARLRMDDLPEHGALLWKAAPLLTRLHVTNEGWRAPDGLRLLGAQADAARLRELHLTFLAGGSSSVATALRDSPNLNQLEAVSLRRAGLTDSDVIDLLEEPRFPQLRRVDFRNNALSGGSLRALRRRPLTQLLFASNRLGQSSVHELANAGSRLEGLERLDLSGNGIGDEGLRVLGRELRFTQLKWLGLSHVNASSDGLGALISGSIAKQVQRLELAGNPLQGPGLRAILGGAFPALTHLDVSETLLGDEGLEVLLESPGSAQLVSLELKKNGLSAKGAVRLATARFPRLEYLSVSGNPLGESGMAALKKAFAHVQLVGRGASEEAE